MIMSDGAMSVNLHPTIPTMLEEAKWMRRLGLKIPDAFHTLNMANVKKTHDQLKVQGYVYERERERERERGREGGRNISWKNCCSISH